MVPSIREDVAARQLPGQGEQRRVVGHVARGEHQPSLQQHHNINTINTWTSYLRATQSLRKIHTNLLRDTGRYTIYDHVYKNL